MEGLYISLMSRECQRASTNREPRKSSVSTADVCTALLRSTPTGGPKLPNLGLARTLHRVAPCSLSVSCSSSLPLLNRPSARIDHLPRLLPPRLLGRVA